MPKRKRLFTEEKKNKLIKEGRGSGIGSEYIPWITIQDVSSKGRSTRLKGIKTNRQHEFLSDMERDYFYILEYLDDVIDIREQYPLLPIEETILIAQELGIKHPQDPRTKEPIVMTTDFVITIKEKNGNIDVARTIKSYDDLMNNRVLEKFEIEKRYWKKHDIDWGVVTEKEINKVFAKNISYAHNYYTLNQLDSLGEIDHEILEDMILSYISRLLKENDTIRNISNNFEKDFMLMKGTGIAIFRYLIINKVIQVNLFEPINVNEKIKVDIIENRVNRELKIL
ncbi:MAG: TnsA endonuclease N-terminal domain-containing protein [Marinisporobacter sp.]|jgi:hypothetical protein|nr:TnsA endonuclease N-terminal domain-containing protein [Marinisporobacter sp.]